MQCPHTGTKQNTTWGDVKAGDIVRVKVMEVDAERKRIALSMRLSDRAGEQGGKRGDNHRARPAPGATTSPKSRERKQDKPAGNGAFAAAFANARKGR